MSWQQGQQFESYPPAKPSDLFQQRQKVQECTGSTPGWQLLCQQLCDPQGKQVPLLWERLVQSGATQYELRMDMQNTVAQ